MSFSGDIEKFSKGSIETADKIRREFILKLFSAVIKDTPVDTGRLRGNWFPKVGSPSREKKETAKENESIPRIPGNLGKFGDTVYMSNNLDYAAGIEYEGRSRIKAPAGMVRINIARSGTILKQITSKYK